MSKIKYNHVIFHMSNPCPKGEELRAAMMNPQDYFNEIGLTYKRAEPNSFTERWNLFDCESEKELPSFFTIVK